MFRRICYPPEPNIRIFNPKRAYRFVYWQLLSSGGYVIRLSRGPTPTPPQGRGVLTVGVNTARRANNQSAQGNALGICLYVSVAPQGQKNEKQLPLPTAFLYGFYSFALSGRYPCCILSRRALPWAVWLRAFLYPPPTPPKGKPTPVPSPREGDSDR